MNALHKSVQVLQLAAAQGSITAKELARTLNLSKSTAYRLIESLTEVRLLEGLGSGEGFALGPLVWELSGGVVLGERVYRKAIPYMASLRDRSGETIGLHTVHCGQRLLLGQEVSHHEHRWVYTNVRVPMPLHAGAASKMLLAQLPTADAEALLDIKNMALLTSHTPHDRNSLLNELERIAADGYALSHEEVTPGVASIAVPIELSVPERSSPVVLSITGPSQRLPDQGLRNLLPILRQTADKIATQVGAQSSLSMQSADRQLKAAVQARMENIAGPDESMGTRIAADQTTDDRAARGG